MIIGKLIKPCKICFFELDKDGSEIESYTLLKLSLEEFTKLFKLACQLNKEIEYPLDGSIVIQYSGNDELHQLWKTTAIEHEKSVPEEFIDVSAKFKTEIPGSSCLLRDPKNHIIWIAYRKGNDKTNINRVCIDNSIRDRFFYDAKTTTYYKTKNKFGMDTQDLNTYTYWSKFMNLSFIHQYREKKNKQKTQAN